MLLTPEDPKKDDRDVSSKIKSIIEVRVPENPSTLASVAYARIHSQIISGEIPPGSRIRIRELCNRLGIGLSPMREALNRLAAGGLVEQSDQRGFSVARLDLADLADLTLARASLNASALRDAIMHGDAAWEEHLVLALHRLRRTPRERVVDRDWEVRHRRFHTALLAGCRSSRLKLYCEQLFDMAERYRLVARTGGGETRDVDAEHEGIVQAALARDADSAVKRLGAHVGRTETLVRLALFDTARDPRM